MCKKCWNNQQSKDNAIKCRYFVHKNVGPKRAGGGDVKFTRAVITIKHPFHETADRKKRIQHTCPTCNRVLDVNITPGLLKRKAMNRKSVTDHIVKICVGTGFSVLVYIIVFDRNLRLDIFNGPHGRHSFVPILQAIAGLGILFVIFMICRRFVDTYDVVGEKKNTEKAYIEHSIEE